MPGIDEIYSRPALIQIDVTSKCNLKCIYCYDERYREQNISSLTLGDLLALTEEIIEKTKPLFVSFSGGEPLMRMDVLFQMLSRFSRSNIDVFLNTNGTLITEEVAEELSKFKIDKISMNIESTNPDKHDFIRGREGSLNLALRGLKNLLEFFDAGRISIATVIIKENFRDILAIADLVSKNSIENYHLIDFIPTCIEKQGYMLNKSEWKEFYSYYRKLRNDHSVKIQPNHAILFLEKKRRSFKTRQLPFCMAGRVKMVITHEGRIVPCNQLKEKEFTAGRVLESKLLDVWKQSDILNFLRSFRPNDPNCRTCASTIGCAGGCRALAYYLSGDLKEPDPYCKEMKLGD
jgi:radical SAM protein with 4Fe4S-binding SPASM domain